ncbi:hypothetical protein BKA83DRAFT_4120047 [Pisolithus microcarpus]|nr:hypothetical protein BKA83DRAFT_4120047 [Pisolithus microcarpus]
MHYLRQLRGVMLDSGACVYLESIALNVGIQEESAVTVPSKKHNCEECVHKIVEMGVTALSSSAVPAVNAGSAVASLTVTQAGLASCKEGEHKTVEAGDTAPSSSAVSAVNAGSAEVSLTSVIQESQPSSLLSQCISPAVPATDGVVHEDTALLKTRAKAKARLS